jgi:hypothetical protein
LPVFAGATVFRPLFEAAVVLVAATSKELSNTNTAANLRIWLILISGK